MCRLTSLLQLLFVAASSETVDVTFFCVAFPPAGDEISVAIGEGNAQVVRMIAMSPYPIFNATVQIDVDLITDLRYEYIMKHSDDTITHETDLFIGQAWPANVGGKRHFQSNNTTNAGHGLFTAHEFFGDDKVYTELPATQLKTIHERKQEIDYHTIYDESMVGVVHLELNPAVWKKLLKDSSKAKGYFGPQRKKPSVNATYTYVNAQSKYHAQEVSLSVAGFGSLQKSKKSFNIHFGKKDEKAWGLKKHKVKAYTYDPSLVREYSTVDVFNAMGVPVHRLAWTRLYVNGQNMGIYNNLETITNPYLHSRFPESKHLPDGALYKCDDKAWMTKETVKLCDCDDKCTVNDHSDLAELARILTETNDQDFPVALEKVFDVPSFVKASAVELASLRRDGYFDDGSNYVLWSNPANQQKWTYVSWDFEIDMFDMDVKVFDKKFSFFKSPFMETTVFPGYIRDIPLTRILTVPKWRAEYENYLRETATLMASEEMQARLTQLHDTVRPYIVKDPMYSLDMAFTPEDFDAAFNTKVEKSKADILAKWITGWEFGIPDIFHSSFLDFELIGVKPFMTQRARNVLGQLDQLP